jgi:hypothetical protein
MFGERAGEAVVDSVRRKRIASADLCFRAAAAVACPHTRADGTWIEVRHGYSWVARPL